MCICVPVLWLCNQCHRLLTITRQWKWQLEIKAGVSSQGQCRPAAAGLGTAGGGWEKRLHRPRTTDAAAAAADVDGDETEEVVARHQNTKKTRHCLLHRKQPL